MAGIIKRFTDIMSANINALLDKAEDPAKMIDQYLRDMESDLGKVKAETAAVMAEEARAKRELDECTEESAKMQEYAKRAVLSGNDNDAKQFLAAKQKLEDKQTALSKAYEAAAQNASKMRSMHDKLVKDIQELIAAVIRLRPSLLWQKPRKRLISWEAVCPAPQTVCLLLNVWKRKPIKC